MNEIERFAREVEANIEGLAADCDVQALSRIWVREITRHSIPTTSRGSAGRLSSRRRT